MYYETVSELQSYKVPTSLVHPLAPGSKVSMENKERLETSHVHCMVQKQSCGSTIVSHPYLIQSVPGRNVTNSAAVTLAFCPVYSSYPYE